MKEEYLWDKTGSDPEIEKLETTLKEFRQKDTTPPTLPLNTLVVEKETVQNKNPFWFLSFGTAAMASVGLVVVSLVFFQLSGTDEKNLVQTISKDASSAQDAILKKEVFSKSEVGKETSVTSENRLMEKGTKISYTKKPKRKGIKRYRYRNARAKKSRARRTNNGLAIQKPKLTIEEKKAYDQLMRALAITSSQFKIVRGKIRGTKDNLPQKKIGL